MRKIYILLTAILLLQSSVCFASDNYDSNISLNSFLKRLVLANARIENSFRRETIYDYQKFPDENKIVISQDTSIILMLYCDKTFTKLQNISVLFFTHDTDEKRGNFYFYGKKQKSEELLYRNVCKQVIFALNTGLSRKEARRILRAIGTYDKYLDCTQRSYTHADYKYIMKLSNDGVLIMNVSHII
ncbi:MAG: hypothetical protein RR272_00905 [Synergistaceae bacterium]